MPKFDNEKWIKHWAGHFGFTYDTMLGLHNTTLLKKNWGTDLGAALYIHSKGYSFAYYREEDYKAFGKEIAKKLIKNPKLAEKWAKDFVNISDENMDFMKKHMNKTLTFSDWQKFTRLFNDYSTLHRPIKVVVDYLPPKLMQKIMPVFTKARLHAEPVYENHEKLIRSFAKKLSKKTGYEYESLRALTNEEINIYLKAGKLPAEKILKARYTGCVVIYRKGKEELIVGKQVKEIENKLAKAFGQTLNGSVAFGGKVRGTVRIIFDPFKPNNFKKGDILVTGMTRPEFLPLMHKAKAFITDAGGMLSHAAITAREMKKPCIVGTEVATKVLKDGDLVEIDATNGVIRKI